MVSNYRILKIFTHRFSHCCAETRPKQKKHKDTKIYETPINPQTAAENGFINAQNVGFFGVFVRYKTAIPANDEVTFYSLLVNT